VIGIGRKKLSALAVVALLVGATGIGFAPYFVKSRETGPVITAFWRVLMALPILLAIRGFEPKRAAPDRPTRSPSRWWLLLPGVFFAADLTIWHWSLHYTQSANATLLTNFAPILVCLVGWLWLGERFRWYFPVALLLALGGAVVVMHQSVQFSRGRLVGDALALATALPYAAYQLSIKRLRGHYSTATVMSWAAGVSALLFLLVALLSGEILLADTLAGWIALVGLAIVSHILGQGAIAWALGHLPASFSSVSLLWQVVVAGVIGWWRLEEQYGLPQIAGTAVVLIGIVLARFGSVVDDKASR